MDADIAVGGVEQFLEVGETELCIRCKGADDAEAHSFVDDLVEVVRDLTGRSFKAKSPRLAAGCFMF